MAHHHKSNKQVEGDPDTGHSRGMPLRPDEEELVERTQVDRAVAGVPGKTGEPEGKRRGEAEKAAEAARKAENADDTDFPPTSYDG
ncbi:hypothetical protein [Actinocorallia lasiicapitis]